MNLTQAAIAWTPDWERDPDYAEMRGQLTVFERTLNHGIFPCSGYSHVLPPLEAEAPAQDRERWLAEMMRRLHYSYGLRWSAIHQAMSRLDEHPAACVLAGSNSKGFVFGLRYWKRRQHKAAA